MQSWKAVVVKFVTFEQTNYFADDDVAKCWNFEQTNYFADDNVEQLQDIRELYLNSAPCASQRKEDHMESTMHI